MKGTYPSDGNSTIAASNVNNDCGMLTIISGPRRIEQDFLTSLLFLLKQSAYQARDFLPPLMFGTERLQLFLDHQL